MTNASQAISLLLVGTGLCAYGYDASHRRYQQQMGSSMQPTGQGSGWPTTQSSSGSGNSSYYYHHYYGGSYYNGYSGGYGSHSSTERGGFGAHGHSASS